MDADDVERDRRASQAKKLDECRLDSERDRRIVGQSSRWLLSDQLEGYVGERSLCQGEPETSAHRVGVVDRIQLMEIVARSRSQRF